MSKSDPYVKGQEDLIKHIKEECDKIVKVDSLDVILDILSLLRSLKPIEKSSDHEDEK